MNEIYFQEKQSHLWEGMMLVLRASILVAAVCGVCLLTAKSATADEIFPDSNLRAVIQEILKQKQIDKPEIAEEDLKTIFFLKAEGRGVVDLTGLEKCTNLAQVELADNKIEGLKPLSNLKNVQFLDVSGNRIEDLTPLSTMVKLQYLQLENNFITSLEGLESLANLTSLYLGGNKVASIEPVTPLAKLHSLHLDDNKVKDLKPVAGLKWLSTLGLRNNAVSDLSPLAGLTELKFTFLEGNPLTDLGTLVEMAKKDLEGDQRFAPYWNIYVDVDSLSDPARQQVEELKKLGVRINRKD